MGERLPRRREDREEGQRRKRKRAFLGKTDDAEATPPTCSPYLRVFVVNGREEAI
jgi:hypothetical protein